MALTRTGETEYALNAAAAETRGYAAVEPIWRSDPQYLGRQIDLQPMVALALAQC